MTGVKKLSLMLLVAGVLSGCATPQSQPPAKSKQYHKPYKTPMETVSLDKLDTVPAARAVEVARLPGVAEVAAKLADKRVVHIGEQHDRLDHHLNQLDIIKQLYAANPKLAIGMEWFQVPHQQALDDYIAGKIDEPTFIRESGYFDHWSGVDYRIVRPIIQFARDNKIPMLALNIDTDLHRKVLDEGTDKLTPEERAQLPTEIDRSDEAYIERLKKYFSRHPGKEEQSLEQRVERWVTGQLLWDEYMAEQAANYLKANPDQRMVVLAGAGHLAYGSGIPKRLERRVPHASAIIINGLEFGNSADLADYVFISRDIALADHGKMGVELDQNKVKLVVPESGAMAAGMETGDEIIAFGDYPVKDYVDIKFFLLERKPGEEIHVTVRRAAGATTTDKSMTVTLK